MQRTVRWKGSWRSRARSFFGVCARVPWRHEANLCRRRWFVAKTEWLEPTSGAERGGHWRVSLDPQWFNVPALGQGATAAGFRSATTERFNGLRLGSMSLSRQTNAPVADDLEVPAVLVLQDQKATVRAKAGQRMPNQRVEHLVVVVQPQKLGRQGVRRIQMLAAAKTGLERHIHGAASDLPPGTLPLARTAQPSESGADSASPSRNAPAAGRHGLLPQQAGMDCPRSRPARTAQQQAGTDCPRSRPAWTAPAAGRHGLPPQRAGMDLGPPAGASDWGACAARLRDRIPFALLNGGL